jgi:hypothetical protein
MKPLVCSTLPSVSFGALRGRRPGRVRHQVPLSPNAGTEASLQTVRATLDGPISGEAARP